MSLLDRIKAAPAFVRSLSENRIFMHIIGYFRLILQSLSQNLILDEDSYVQYKVGVLNKSLENIYIS